MRTCFPGDEMRTCFPVPKVRKLEIFGAVNKFMKIFGAIIIFFFIMLSAPIV